MGAQEQPPRRRVNILTELLVALTGRSGDAFVYAESTTADGLSQSERSCSFLISPEVDFLAAAERATIQELLLLGQYYRELDAFVRREELSWIPREGSEYRCALANGIRELLDVYIVSLLQIHKRLRSSTTPSLATLNYYLAEFKVCLPTAHYIASEVSVRALKGCDILHLLHHKACSGIPELKSCLARLQWHCHQKLIKQLQAWMVHGLLEDKHGEFFIQPAEPQLAQQTTDQRDGHASALDWHRSFEVRMDLLPPGITDDTPLSILFIGKSVRALYRPGRSQDATDLGAEAALNELQAAPVFDATAFELIIEAIRKKASEQLWDLLLTDGQLPRHLTALRDYFLLGRGDFWQTFLLESSGLMALPAVRATAEANISIHFQQSASKSSAESDPFFGHVSIKFPMDAAVHSEMASVQSMRTTMTAPITRDSHRTEVHAGRVSSEASDRVTTPAVLSSMRPLSLPPLAGLLTQPQDEPSPNFTPQSGEQRAGRVKRSLKVPEYDPDWDPLTLEFRVEWPLHLLLSHEVMMRYSRMFQYLLRLKRLQLDLESTWAAVKTGQAPDPVGKSTVPLWQVRSQMAHLINNFLLYIQVDVIEVQFQKMMSSIGAVRDLKAAAKAHEAFLAACIVQSCLDVPVFSTLLSKLLIICRSFCSAFRTDGTVVYPAKPVEEFQRSSRLLYKLLSTPSMQSRARAPFLRQLLLRLNFNGFAQADTDRHAVGSFQPTLRSS